MLVQFSFATSLVEVNVLMSSPATPELWNQNDRNKWQPKDASPILRGPVRVAHAVLIRFSHLSHDEVPRAEKVACLLRARIALLEVTCCLL
jgi:hypothetical protein